MGQIFDSGIHHHGSSKKQILKVQGVFFAPQNCAYRNIKKTVETLQIVLEIIGVFGVLVIRRLLFSESSFVWRHPHDFACFRDPRSLEFGFVKIIVTKSRGEVPIKTRIR